MSTLKIDYSSVCLTVDKADKDGDVKIAVKRDGKTKSIYLNSDDVLALIKHLQGHTEQDIEEAYDKGFADAGGVKETFPDNFPFD